MPGEGVPISGDQAGAAGGAQAGEVGARPPATGHRGKVAVVTGGASGIGRAVARRLQREGASTWVLDVARPAAEDPAGPPPAAHLPVDVGDEEAVDAAFAAIASREGRVDYLVCCAAVFPRRPFLQLTERDWRDTLRVNLTGSFLCARAAVRHMIPRRSGRIVLFSSMLARVGGSRCGPYAASKGGVLGLARSLALEVAADNIRVNTISPGITDTPQPRSHMSSEELSSRGEGIPLGRIGTVEDMTEVCLFLLGDDSSYLTGHDLRCNGGAALW